MFTYFHNRKLKYNKGQLAPFFIVIMVAIVIMAMVTVNLSKVALTKTESANSADAGALAAGSIMANVFNSIAKQNALMEFQYWTFFTSVSVSFTLAIGALTVALSTACATPCFALKAASIAMWTIAAIGIAISAFKIAQFYTLQIIKDKIGVEGRESAVKAGHQFVFINSGIGSKLKEGTQRDDFKNFMDGISYIPAYTYSWQDGQARAHNVTSTVLIDSVDKFDMQAILMPEIALATLLFLANLEVAMLVVTLGTLCVCSKVNPACLAGCAVSIPMAVAVLVTLAAAWAGLTPTGSIIEDAGGSILGAIITPMWIYAWIDDIDHNRKVEVRTTQHHGGTDLGLWTAQYPDTFSSSRVDFKGNGKIHPPKLRHDASIEAVDFP